MVTAFHTTKRGASHGIAFANAADLEAHLKKMRQPVRVMCKGEEVGGVWKNEGRWVWWYDQSVFEQSDQKTICPSRSMYNLCPILRVSRGNVVRDYRPTPASWRRFVRLSLNDRLGGRYKSFRVLPSASFGGKPV